MVLKKIGDTASAPFAPILTNAPVKQSITDASSNIQSSKGKLITTCDTEKCEKYREDAMQNIIELVSTEKNYIKDLTQMMKYMDYIEKSKRNEEGIAPMPIGLKRGKDNIAFGNLRDVLEFHQKQVYF